MKRFFLIVLGGFCIINLTYAGIKVIKTNCPHITKAAESNGPKPTIGDPDGSDMPQIYIYDCIPIVNGDLQFCLFLQRSEEEPLSGFQEGLIHTRMSINGIEDEFVSLKDFSKNIINGIIEYKYMYITNIPVNLENFQLTIEVLWGGLIRFGLGSEPSYVPLNENSGFHFIEDDSFSGDPSVFTMPVTICPEPVNDNNIENTSDICINDGVFISNATAKLSNSVKSNKTKTFNDGLINVYPNPFYNVLNINITQEKSQFAIISLYNVQGKLLRQINKEANSFFMINEKLETANLPIGIYIVEVLTDKERKDFKVVKTR